MAKQFVVLELDRPRRLRYGMNALIMAEDLIGKPLSALDFNGLLLKELRAIIYAGLSWEDKDLTPDKIGDLIDEYSDLKTVGEKLAQAIEQSFGKNG